MKVVKLQYIYKLLHDCSISVATCKKSNKITYLKSLEGKIKEEEKERKNALSGKTFDFLSRKPDVIEIISTNDW